MLLNRDDEEEEEPGTPKSTIKRTISNRRSSNNLVRTESADGRLNGARLRDSISSAASHLRRTSANKILNHLSSTDYQAITQNLVRKANKVTKEHKKNHKVCHSPSALSILFVILHRKKLINIQVSVHFNIH